MDYDEALKKVQATKLKENYMVIELAYNSKVILPYKDGAALLLALNNAEQLMEPYNEQHRIAEFDRSSITVKVMSHAEYVRYKIAALLGVKPDEVKQYENVTA